MTEQFNALNFQPPRMETIRNTAAIFGLPVHFVRQKVSSGEIVAVRAGRRFLVNIEKFAEYLNTNKIQPEECNIPTGIIPVDKVRY